MATSISRPKVCMSRVTWGKIITNTMEQTMPSVIGITALVTMSQLMGGTGQTDVLAYGVANGTGPVYPIFAPFIGVLGAFLTSSNLASNLLFGGLQDVTAGVLGLRQGEYSCCPDCGWSYWKHCCTR
ncbi:MAG: L-lactate permease [Bacillota bacterium]